MPLVWRNRAFLIADALVALWIVIWIVLGIVVAREVRQLADLSDTVVAAGGALDETGDGLRDTSAGLREVDRALQFVETLPIVGQEIEENIEDAADNIDRVASEVERTARSAQASGRSSKESAEDLSVILGFAVALVPAVALLAAYAPVRSTRLRAALGLRA